METNSFDNRDGYIWMDGKLVPWREAQLHVLTHALHYASSVFEGERVYEGEVFKLNEHNQRLLKSAEIMGFEIPYSLEELNAATRETVAASGLSDAYVRPIAWRGSEMMGVSAQKNTIHVAIAAWAWGSYFPMEERMKGIRLGISDWRRPDPRTAPVMSKTSGLYSICTMSKHAAEQQGYQDALLLDWQDRVAEATGANIFFTRDGVLHTPIADCFLDGITRRTVIDLARRRGFEVVERRILPDEMADFEECFLTGSAAEVTPVREIGPYNFAPGAICRQLAGDYEALVRRRAAA